MTTYIVKRILLMIPTLFLIILVVFGLLQLAPGKPTPGQAGSMGVESTQSMEGRESYRIFKEQFNLDKPILLNTRYAIETSEVLDELLVLADFARPICPEDAPATPNCVPADERPESAAVIAAQNRVEDLGVYIVPALYEIAKTSKRDDVRILALNQLTINAQFDLRNEFSANQSQADKDYNKKMFPINREIASWTLPADATTAQIDAMVEGTWTPWMKEHAERFEYSFGEKFKITFGDTRFAKYMANIIHFDFGISSADKQPIMPTVMEKAKVSIVLGFFSIFFAYLISVPLGVWSAYKQHTVADQVVTVGLFLLYSLPSFFTAVLVLQWLTIGNPFEWFPTGGFQSSGAEHMTTLERVGDIAYHMILPVFCLTYGALASLSRYARAGLLDVIRADYIRTARAKGLSEPMVIIKHAVRNGMIPILTLLGTLLPAIIGGSVVLEFVFNLPGLGLYMLNSIFLRDYNAIMAITLVSAVLTLVGILLSDLSYAVVDPRISFD
jgi:peptide/nickel transport system permease protein